MTKKINKLNLSQIRADDQAARAFVRGANAPPTVTAIRPDSTTLLIDTTAPPRPDEPGGAPELKLIINGYLKNRTQRCRAPLQLYLLHELADWIDAHANGGRGGVQTVLNELIRRGIESVESEVKARGVQVVRLD